jgi:hypothetical protein
MKNYVFCFNFSDLYCNNFRVQLAKLLSCSFKTADGIATAEFQRDPSFSMLWMKPRIAYTVQIADESGE